MLIENLMIKSITNRFEERRGTEREIEREREREIERES